MMGQRASVSEQVRYINTAISMGGTLFWYRPIPRWIEPGVAKSQKQRGILVLTWDSDVNPEYRQFYVNQGTQTFRKTSCRDGGNQRGSWRWREVQGGLPLLISYSDRPKCVVRVAKEIIETEHPDWEIVTTQYSDMDSRKLYPLVNKSCHLSRRECHYLSRLTSFSWNCNGY